MQINVPTYSLTIVSVRTYTQRHIDQLQRSLQLLLLQTERTQGTVIPYLYPVTYMQHLFPSMKTSSF